MKTKLFQSFAIVATLLLFGVNSYAADQRLILTANAAAGSTELILGQASTNGNTVTTPISKGVVMSYDSDAIDYSLGALHTSGNREYATNNDVTSIWWTPCNAGDACGFDTPLAGVTDNADIIDGWSSM